MGDKDENVTPAFDKLTTQWEKLKRMFHCKELSADLPAGASCAGGYGRQCLRTRRLSKDPAPDPKQVGKSRELENVQSP